MKQNCWWISGVIALLVWPTPMPAQDRPWRPPAPVVPDNVKVLRDLEYVPHGHERNRLDLYLPPSTDHPLPVIVWIHGGGWQNGNKDRPTGLSFVAQGYALAAINYRLSQHAPFPAQIHDCKAAIRWLRANAAKYHLDADHIGVWGASAGGHLVALLGTTGDVKELEGAEGNPQQSSRVQAVVDLFGPTDLATMGGWHDDPGSPEARLIGGPIQQNKDRAAKASPVTYVNKDAAPFLILHGNRDTTVPIGQSQELAAALKKAGVEATFITVEGAGHGGPQFMSAENRQRIEAFFAKHLR